MKTNSQVICIFIENCVTPFTKICVHLAKLHHDVLRRDVHAEVVLGEEVVPDGRHVGHHKVDAVVLAREENNKSVYILYLSKEGPISIRPFNFKKHGFI